MDGTTTKPLTMELTSEQRASRAPLLDAGNRILSILYRCGDQATDEQRAEHYRLHGHLCRIWNEALVEPIEPTSYPPRHAPPPSHSETAAFVLKT